ncbi:hypothetical protein F5Y16DRAFT_407097 [Xylariaceae sp. FL0255]|nr:hypothetical protein F5Y16DRAFT_407097 [Xylariaceae sp. FL0255]
MSSTIEAAPSQGSNPRPEGDIGNSRQDELLDNLKSILAEQSHLFACGGEIPIRDPKAPFLPGEKRESDPITIPSVKLSLPQVAGAEAELNRLLKHSQPATFGRGGQDVYGESYRKALKMDTDAFCTTFDPYSVGIIDTVAPILLPSVSGSLTHRCVQAELYKLNVYSGPSGKFKPHIDTPRSTSQFGSLVVCLPLEHEGGQLKVRHKGQEITFDWSASHDKPDRPKICWVAFYSDCEHEVLEVASGHRLTLTYNLYAVRGAGQLTGVSPTLKPIDLPLFQELKGILSQDLFDGQGGTLGFWCSHIYTYNNPNETPMPATLKGVDAVLWESFLALNLDTQIAPVMRMIPTLITCPWAIRRRERLPSSLPLEWIIGHKFGVHVNEEYEMDTIDDYDKQYRSWGSYSREPVHWVTTPKQSELQLVYTAYGNEASAGTMYSHCAILVNLPPHA